MKTKENPARMLWQLFKATFLLSAFTFGGGFVIVSLMKKKFVEDLQWLEEEEMLDITAIAQSSPGPIPINASVILGYRMYGVIGSLVAILGTALPPMIIISVISVFYTQFRSNRIIAIALQVMRAGVAAVIFDVVINLAKSSFWAGTVRSKSTFSAPPFQSARAAGRCFPGKRMPSAMQIHSPAYFRASEGGAIPPDSETRQKGHPKKMPLLMAGPVGVDITS